MGRTKKPKLENQRANFSVAGAGDAAALENPRERVGSIERSGPTETEATSATEINKPIGARPRSEVTGRHDAGSGANETPDGLSSLDEAVRHGAEDIPLGPSIEDADEEADDVPVFDRADRLPKI